MRIEEGKGEATVFCKYASFVLIDDRRRRRRRRRKIPQ